MEEVAKTASKNVDCAEKDLAVLVSRKEPAYTRLEAQLSRLRIACQDFVFVDFNAATASKTETRLWDAHAKVNQKFRPLLAKFRDPDSKKKHVERRKAEKLYLEFIKSSMRFYRGYVQRLASHFRDIPEVVDVAKKFGLDTLSAEPAISVDELQKKQIVRSCYLSLVQLGDLSRYRETELQTKQRDWGPAKGYYQLAIALDPHSGVAYNQLAVIALTDEDHIRAVYYLYRAIMVQNPAPQAPGNLEIEFRKIRNRVANRKPISSSDVNGDNGLSDQFIIYHSRCAEEGFVFSDDQQNEILQRLADDLREKPFDARIRKFCLINIAAEDASARRVRGKLPPLLLKSYVLITIAEDISPLQIYQGFQQLNIGTFFLLLKLMLDELQQLARGPEPGTPIDEELVPVTPVTRRILPHLRLYSSWLLSKVEYLLANNSMKVQMREFWCVYTEALSLLVVTYPIIDIAEIPYLLDEDVDTLGFSPFPEVLREQRGLANSKYNEARFGPRSPANEMLYRIKSLVKDAVLLCRREFGSIPIPLKFAGNCFVFLDEDGQPPMKETPASPHHGHQNSISRDDIEAAKQPTGAAGYSFSYHEDVSDAGASASVTSAMENMVNNLTRPEALDHSTPSIDQTDESHYPVLKTPTAQSFAERGLKQSQRSGYTAQDFVQPIHRSSSSSFPSLGDAGTNRPILPSIMNSPFAPRPGETPGSPPPANVGQRLRGSREISPQTRHFQASLLQQQQAIQNRTSPAVSPQPTMSSLSKTPSNVISRGWKINQSQPGSSQWSSPLSAGLSGTIVRHRAPEPAPFGAIGEPRPKSSGAPVSGQLG
ncbi:hypothetical protein LTR84_002924 [Exophiala bonariae]|uniref:DNA/RNA-binding domain-containing protein n=1 Tax=Exophiala bonariae TaxID=1690606 RepID=A0AAV9N998_9EURO|nr:hypothetical protein LTR84_002924 [Exophiala bonariae]